MTSTIRSALDTYGLVNARARFQANSEALLRVGAEINMPTLLNYFNLTSTDWLGLVEVGERVAEASIDPVVEDEVEDGQPIFTAEEMRRLAVFVVVLALLAPWLAKGLEKGGLDELQYRLLQAGMYIWSAATYVMRAPYVGEEDH
ncbi:MAG: hypothetical protein JWN67_4451 [Actinomycetia bacterium]|nr:hypothetical protein [Actinomycetes bacterium]